MRAIAAGDSNSFGLLMQRHLAGMVTLAQRISGNKADADEIAQEAFLRLWRQAKEWDVEGKAQVRTWLGRVVTNLCLDRWRKKPMLPLEYADDVADTAQSGFDAVQEMDKKQLLNDCLQRLPLRQRTAIILSYYEEMSGNDIATMMGLSAGAVESLLVRARRALRQDLSTMQIEKRSDL